MKKYLYLLAFALIFLSLFALVSCGGCNHSVKTYYPVVDPTCTESGIGELRCCECRKVMETYTIYPSGHQYDVIKEVESTCTEQGYVARVCINCDEIFILEYLALAGHTEEIIPGVESTCTEHGTTDGKKCFVCQTVLVEQEEAPLKAHTYDNDEDATCNGCGYERFCPHRNTVVLEGKDATCTSTGLTEGKKCEDCSEILIEQEVVPMLEHDYKTVTVTDPTCETQGYTTYTCDCGAFYHDNYVDALGHGFGEWMLVEEATKEKEGLKERYCDCGEKESEIIPMLKPSQGLEFALNDDGKSYSVTGLGICTDLDIVIPDTHEGLPVTSIGEYAFYNCTLLTSIVISDSVTSIGDFALCLCRSLTSVKIGNSVTSIGMSAFVYCESLTKIVIPDSVTSIGFAAFANCYKLTIYCEAESQPNGWASDWNHSNRPVVWGYKGE